jgi:hypothetical protein
MPRECRRELFRAERFRRASQALRRGALAGKDAGTAAEALPQLARTYAEAIPSRELLGLAPRTAAGSWDVCWQWANCYCCTTPANMFCRMQDLP